MDANLHRFTVGLVYDFRFLSRHLSAEDLEYFDDVRDQYEVNFHLKEILRFLDDKKNETKKRNRRFEAMKKMMEQGKRNIFIINSPNFKVERNTTTKVNICI